MKKIAILALLIGSCSILGRPLGDSPRIVRGTFPYVGANRSGDQWTISNKTNKKASMDAQTQTLAFDPPFNNSPIVMINAHATGPDHAYAPHPIILSVTKDKVDIKFNGAQPKYYDTLFSFIAIEDKK